MDGKLGTDLHPADQRFVLSAYVHRFTGSHRPKWAKPDNAVQFADDQDWLAHTRFAVRANGRLDRRVARCHSSPTWPHNPELRGHRVASNGRLFAP
ncbi:hypothetical protein [Bradyrhizobium stylosanthis]|nr:hypothetical protein [Bradyrhizobium stylosanthis]